ncbi:hypothetical protein ACPOL_1701 [Acidisarcina polymorpha]|uniref:Uncharacterized protein n=1 Tax=Acidisarcina polymorpha TaxID=2211140 RepID=A0A2Z5FXD7_9BACT|nr:hypothetical protein ACPOL_1701 [Acidisarcina polymorpha]
MLQGELSIRQRDWTLPRDDYLRNPSILLMTYVMFVEMYKQACKLYRINRNICKSSI